METKKQSNAFQRKYGEYIEGWHNELKQSGWGEKFQQPITPELIREFQFEYLQELAKDEYSEDWDIVRVSEFILYMIKTYAKEEDVRYCFKVGNTPGMWAYLTSHYFE